MDGLTSFLPTIPTDHDPSRDRHGPDSLDKLLSGFDKENESHKRNLNSRKPSAHLEGERSRERNSRIGPLANLSSNNNQTTKLPDIYDPQYSEVTNKNKQARIIFPQIDYYFLFFFFSSQQKALASASWMDGDRSGSAHTTRFELPMDMKTLEGTIVIIMVEVNH